MSKPKKLYVAIYLGEELNFRGAIYKKFRTESGELIRFSKISGVMFGRSYAWSEAAGSMSRWPEQVFDSGLEVTDQERKEYEVNKLAVAAKRLQKSQILKDKKPHADIVKAIKLLKPFVKGMDFFTVHKFLEYVFNECYKKGKK